MKYRKKPVVISALQYDGENFDKINYFMDGTLRSHPIHGSPLINTLEGDHLVSKGDFIIRGVHGEYYSCKPDIFEKTYEKVND